MPELISKVIKVFEIILELMKTLKENIKKKSCFLGFSDFCYKNSFCCFYQNKNFFYQLFFLLKKNLELRLFLIGKKFIKKIFFYQLFSVKKTPKIWSCVCL